MNSSIPKSARFSVLGLWLFGLTATAPADPAPASPAGPDHIVRMEPVKFAATFDILGQYKKGTKILDSAKVTWAAPSFTEAGLEKGDVLVSVDGRPVNGMSGAELVALLDITLLEPGVKRTFIFFGRRGPYGQSHWTTTASFVGRPPKSDDGPMGIKPTSIQSGPSVLEPVKP
jgi:hypothetical protein